MMLMHANANDTECGPHRPNMTYSSEPASSFESYLIGTLKNCAREAGPGCGSFCVCSYSANIIYQINFDDMTQ